MFEYTTYTVNCGEHETKIAVHLDLTCGIPFIQITKLESKDKVKLRFLDRESVENLLLSLQIVKNEMDRFHSNDQSVS